jgi:hypothetical protein
VGRGAEGEPNPNRQNDQDDRADDSCGSEESHRHFIHWRIKTLPGFTASWSLFPPCETFYLESFIRESWTSLFTSPQECPGWDASGECIEMPPRPRGLGMSARNEDKTSGANRLARPAQ